MTATVPAGSKGDSDGTTAVSAVVVNYESGPMLAQCASHLLASGVDRVVVVDNGSADGSMADAIACVPGIIVVSPGRNLGYGAGANRGVAATESELIVVCNPDLSFSPEAVTTLVAALADDTGTALVGPLLRMPGGARYPSARRFPSLVDAAGHALLGLFVPDNRFTRAYRRSDLDAFDSEHPLAGPGGTRLQTVDWVSGACFLVRRKAWEEVGGFDESFFMYAEDVDLCWRLGRAGWRVGYVPGAEVTHAQGVSTDSRPYRMIIEHHRSLLRFAFRSTSGWRRTLLPLMALGVGIRALLALARRVSGH